MMYQIWLIPTDEGKKLFKNMCLKAIEAPFDDPEEAGLEAYLMDIDGRAPDQSDYYSYKALPVEDA